MCAPGAGDQPQGVVDQSRPIPAKRNRRQRDMYSPEEGISKAPVTSPAGAAAEAGAKKTFLVRAAAAARVGHEQRRKDHEDCHDSDAELPSVPTTHWTVSTVATRPQRRWPSARG